uniref:Uncharacterized protein n=1 Tax=Nelumbo nucifera TaxID=4432 RepID=A0A822Z022_NELNU|nr:TPA_asm: hypothetical protein HUJ06_008758 [Nelumbo nucifera]
MAGGSCRHLCKFKGLHADNTVRLSDSMVVDNLNGWHGLNDNL